MTSQPQRRAVLQAGAALLGAAMLPAASAQAEGIAADTAGHEFMVKDLVYQTHGGKPRLARLYQPAGRGPFPAVLQVHGGAWNNKDRTDGQNTALDLAEAGIVVLSIDFRNAPEAPYPASLQDINYGIRWLKAHAAEFGSTATQVGAYGTSSGGHQILLAAIRPDDPRYRALPLADAPDMDAKLGFVISGWGVLFPLERYKLAKAKGDDKLAHGHDIFFGSEATQIEATPALAIERGEKVFLPPALVFQGTQDQWTSVALAERFAKDYRDAGGEIDLLLLEGARHTFLNEHPFEPNSVKALETMIAFIKTHGAERHAQR
ncbi:MAG TPA: alpha/beta hydrolase [Xanthobacteraceae bacterium]|nr:alpha/beta hydrolase [Xanthobacteraceae bacterium]